MQRGGTMIATLALAVMSLLLHPECVDALMFERVQLLDYITNSTSDDFPVTRIVVRGDVPAWNNDNTKMNHLNTSLSFLYEELTQFINMRLAEAGKPIIENWRQEAFLVDFNLLSPSSIQQNNSILAEQRFFQENPNLGQFYSWPTIGTPISPETMSQANISKALHNSTYWGKEINRDDIINRVELMRNVEVSKKLLGPNRNFVVVYVHCIGGQDRTGEMSGSYLMRHKGVTAPNALLADWVVAQRWPQQDQRNLMQWYCYWLQEDPSSPLDKPERRNLACGKMYPLAPQHPKKGLLECDGSTFLECGYNSDCLWINGNCLSNCRQWTTKETCESIEKGCEWDLSARLCLATKTNSTNLKLF